MKKHILFLTIITLTIHSFAQEYDLYLTKDTDILTINTKSDTATNNVDGNTIEEAPYLSIQSCVVYYDPFYEDVISDPVDIAVGPLESKLGFNIDANVSWNVEIAENDTWLTVVDISDTTFLVLYDQNCSENSRTAAITVQGGGLTDSVRIMQEAPFLYLSEQDVGLICAANIWDEDAIPHIYIESNIPVTFSSSDSWIWYSEMGNYFFGYSGRFYISSSQNNIGHEPRYGQIYASTDICLLKDTLLVNQDFCFMNVDPDSLSFSYKSGERQSVMKTIRGVTTLGEPTVSTNSTVSEWLTMNPLPDYSIAQEIGLLTIDDNHTGDERSGEIIIRYSLAEPLGITLRDTIFISQSSGSPLPSGWTVNPANYGYNGQVTGQVIVDLDTIHSGYLGAFVGEECRGYGESSYFSPSDHHVFDLLIYSDSTSGEVISFKFYDTVANRLYDLYEEVEFEENMIVGTAMEPFNLHYYIDYEKTCVTGWNWFSVNVLQEDMSIENVMSSEMLPFDYIKSQTQSATFYDDYGWFGRLTEIDPTKLYMAKFGSDNSIRYPGTSVNPDTTTIKLVPGWNWIGFLPKAAMPIEEALGSLSVSELDYIKNQTSSATYYKDTGWFGNLTELKPGDGYMLRVSNTDTLKYPSGSVSDSKKKASVHIEKKELDPHVFEYNGSITARVFMNGVPAGSENDLLLAYVGQELRGIERGYYFESDNTHIYPLMIYSNKSQGETVTFIYYSSKDNQFYKCEETVPFERDMILSNAYNSLELNINGPAGSSNPKTLYGPSLSVYPNPFHEVLRIDYSIDESSDVTLAVYDIYGKMIRLLKEGTLTPGSYSIELESSDLQPGAYIIRLNTNKKHLIKRIISIN